MLSDGKKPLNILPGRAVSLSDSRELEAMVDQLHSHHRERPNLRVSGVPVNECNQDVMRMRLDIYEPVNA